MCVCVSMFLRVRKCFLCVHVCVCEYLCMCCVLVCRGHWTNVKNV